MKKIIMAAIAAGLICSTVPAFAVDVAATTATGAVKVDTVGLGLDMAVVGKTPDEHRVFTSKLAVDERARVTAACKVEDKGRTPDEKAFCADIM